MYPVSSRFAAESPRAAGPARRARRCGCASTPIEKLPRIVCDPSTRPRIAGVMTRTFCAGFNAPKCADRQRSTEMTATSTPTSSSAAPRIKPALERQQPADPPHARALGQDAATLGVGLHQQSEPQRLVADDRERRRVQQAGDVEAADVPERERGGADRADRRAATSPGTTNNQLGQNSSRNRRWRQPSRKLRRCGARERPSGRSVVGTSLMRRSARLALTIISLANSMPPARRPRSTIASLRNARMPQWKSRTGVR